MVLFALVCKQSFGMASWRLRHSICYIMLWHDMVPGGRLNGLGIIVKDGLWLGHDRLGSVLDRLKNACSWFDSDMHGGIMLMGIWPVNGSLKAAMICLDCPICRLFHSFGTHKVALQLRWQRLGVLFVFILVTGGKYWWLKSIRIDRLPLLFRLMSLLVEYSWW